MAVTHAEVAAVRSLRTAVIRYAERIRAAIASARRDADALVRQTEEAVRMRTADLNRALGELRQTEAALSGCRDERQAAALRGEVAARRHRADECRQLHGYALQAVKIAVEARSALAKTMQSLEATVGEHSSVSSSALAVLDQKLAAIDMQDAGSLGPRLRRAAAVTLTSGAVAVETLIGAGHVGALIETIRNGSETVDGRPVTSQQMRAEQTADSDEELATSVLEDLERRGEDLGRR